MKRVFSVLIVLTVLMSGTVYSQEKAVKTEPQGIARRESVSVQLEPIKISTIMSPDSDEALSVFTETVIQEGGILPEIPEDDFPGFGEKIAVDFRGMPVSDVLKFLAAEGSINIAIAPDVTGVVNLFIEDVAIRDIFEIILATNRLAYRVKGNIITIISNNEYRLSEGVDFFDRRQTVVYQLKYASAQALGTFLGNIKSDIGKIIFDDSTGLLVLVDTAQKIKEMKVIVDRTDIPTVARVLPTETIVYELQYALAEDIQGEVSAALTPTIGTMQLDVRTNTLIITDLPHQMEKIMTIVRAFDRKTRQVFIEAKIVQVTLTDAYKWGIDWSRLFDESNRKPGLHITPAVDMPLSLSTFGKLTVSRTQGTRTLSAILEILATIGETKILSNPHIATEEGKEASINVITSQPYSQSTTTTTDAATTQSTEFTFVEVGVKLNVIPRINADGYISMVIKPEVSSITSFFPDSASEQRVPVIETAIAESTVLVKDGTTIIIAGMIKDTKTLSENRVPGLGRIPIIGKLFSNKSDEIQRTETIVFLTPRIITGDESFLLNRDMIKALKGLRK